MNALPPSFQPVAVASAEQRGEIGPARPRHALRTRADHARDGVLTACVLSGIAYLGWRATAFNPAHPIWSAVFYAAELLGFLVSLLRFHVMRQATEIVPPGPWHGHPWPNIDILVPTYGEDVAVVRRTVYAAMRVRRAAQVWLLDDAASPRMAELAREMGCKYLPRLENRGAKAGNLNHGLSRSRSEFFAVFDADHAPEACFLERVMAWFDDPRVAFVQTPQDYFNIDSYQHGHAATARDMWHEQSLFHWTEQPGRHAMGGATCCGCSMVFRRSAIDAIGGFPTETVTEDMHASVKLHKAGWRSVFHPEPLAYGIAPASAREFVRQRLRWGEGNMQVCRLEGIPFARDLSLAQNLSYLMLGTTYLEAWLKLTFYTAPILYLFTSIAPIATPLGTYLALFVPYFLLTLLTMSELGRGYGPFFRLEQFAMARIAAGLGATWGAFRRNIPFRVSAKGLSADGAFAYLLPQWTILAFATGGLLVFGARALAGTVPADRGVGFVLAGLSVYIAYMAAWVILNGLRTLRLPRDRWVAPEPFPVRDVETDRLINALGLSTDQVVLPGTIPRDRPRRFELFVGGHIFETLATPAPDGAWQLAWPDAGTRDAFEHALLVAPWRSILVGRSERSRTILERLGILRPPADCAELAKGDWGLWSDGAGQGLVVLKPERSGDDKPNAILFGLGSASSRQVTIRMGERRWTAQAEPLPDWHSDSPLTRILREYGARHAVLCGQGARPERPGLS